MVSNKDKYVAGNSGTGGGAGAADINKDEDVSSNSNNTTVGGLGKSARKQLKMSKSKILVDITNCKRSHLSKKTAAIKLS